MEHAELVVWHRPSAIRSCPDSHPHFWPEEEGPRKIANKPMMNISFDFSIRDSNILL